MDKTLKLYLNRVYNRLNRFNMDKRLIKIWRIGQIAW